MFLFKNVQKEVINFSFELYEVFLRQERNTVTYYFILVEITESSFNKLVIHKKKYLTMNINADSDKFSSKQFYFFINGKT